MAVVRQGVSGEPVSGSGFAWRRIPGFRALDKSLTFTGEIVMLLGDSFGRMFRGRLEWRETLNQMAFIGVASVPIVALTGFFSGAVFSLYLSQFLVQYGAGSFVGATIGLAMAREVGPVIAGLMVAARCGSAMAAQIGSMQVTEQVDALRMLSVHPTNYLVIPRLIACILMLPVLALICTWTGTIGGGLVASTMRVPLPSFVTSLQAFVAPGDVFEGMVKAPVFGLLIATVSCQQGMRTAGGAVGVGKSTTNAVVISMVGVYVADFLLARLMRQ